MAARKKGSTTPHHKFKKISEETLTALVDARQDSDLAQAEAQNLLGHFQLMVARELKNHSMPIRESTICMGCGTIRPAQVPCPECPATPRG